MEMDINEILSHFKPSTQAASLNDEDKRQFHDEQQCDIAFAGLQPVIRMFL